MSRLAKIEISLAAEQIEMLEDAVKGGDYATASDVVGEALRDWQSRRELGDLDIEWLRLAVEEGRASGVAGKVDFDELRAEARRRLKLARSRLADAG